MPPIMKMIRALSHLPVLLWLALPAISVGPTGCRETAAPPPATRFTAISPDVSGIDFVNRVAYTEELNCYTFRNFYNGGGVGVGDFNRDGLPDLYFCGNMVSNRLYLNRGELRFEDITAAAGVGSRDVWSSGVAVADVNGDGWLDLYVCKSGPPGGPQRRNELFINNATEGAPPTFTESAVAYGLDDEGLSVHAAFLDFDRDGDLDLYLLNNSLRSVGGYDLIRDQRNIPDPQGGNKLYRQDRTADGRIRFTDVSAEAGIYRSQIGFGLGVAVGDLDLDGAQDLFVSNDFFERDYLYLNRSGISGAPSFREVLETSIRETSMGSMGADIADLNNDGRPDIFVTEMLPADDRRIKTKTKFEGWDLYRREVQNGYYHQFTRNTLQLNLGPAPAKDSSSLPVFAETARLAGVHATDWSWGALILDMDNDGWKDIFVANGIGKDLTDQDYVNFYSDPEQVRKVLHREGKAITRMVDAMPAEPLPNYAFRNALGSPDTGGPAEPGALLVPTFENLSAEWGLDQTTFSNGSAYADLDNDGDLDLVLNNQDMPAAVYRNNTAADATAAHFLNLRLVGSGANTHAIGAKARLYAAGLVQYLEVAPMRGFESTVDSRLHFGLGAVTLVDSLVVTWPDGTVSRRTQVAADQFLVLDQAAAVAPDSGGEGPVQPTPWLRPFRYAEDTHRHHENEFNDFDRDPLLFQMYSDAGPPMCRGDVNGDGRDDLFIGGARDAAGTWLIQGPDGRFTRRVSPDMEKDRLSEDTACTLFDADGDGDLDLYVGSGGSEFPGSSAALLDRLYLNDGNGGFRRAAQSPLPSFESTGTVCAADFDGDGDQDLFVGIRLRPFLHGVPCSGYLLENDGQGRFRDVTATRAAALKDIGMIGAAVWTDIDRDGDPDLVVAGEWMAVTVLTNTGGRFEARPLTGRPLRGWWNSLLAVDIDGDGAPDLVAGNHGRNSRFKAGFGRPLTMWVNDFDQNGSAEQILCAYNGEASYPMVLRGDLLRQLPYLKKKYLYFKDYANQTIEDLFTPAQLSGAVRLEAEVLTTGWFRNRGDGSFEFIELPAAAQFSPVYAVAAADINRDGHIDLVLGGNKYRAKPETGIYDGSVGLLCLGDGQGGFRPLLPAEAGLSERGEIRSLAVVPTKRGNCLFVGKNDAELTAYSW